REGAMRLANRIALITGGTSGIGRATAVLFAQEGARVALTGRDETRGLEVAKRIENAGGKALFVRADVRLAADCRHAVERTLATFGGLDILFNNAGVFFPHTVPDCPEEEWHLTTDVHLKAPYRMTKY